MSVSVSVLSARWPVLVGHPVSAAAAQSEQLLYSSVIMGLVCRLCADPSPNTTNIFSEKGLQLRLPEKIQKCLPVLVSRDRLISPCHSL